MFSSNMIFVTADEARNYYVPPNTKMLLMDKEKPQFYVKSSDGQLDTYTFAKVEPTPPVTKQDLDAFKQEILSLLNPNKEVPNNDANTQSTVEW